MGTSLNGTTPQNTYPSLIKIGDNGAVDATLQRLSDGDGNDLPLLISSTSVTNLGGGAASGCTAFGESALLDNLTGANNTAIGKSSLENNTASNNVAVGYEAALTNTTGTGITAIGYQALRANSTGINNTALGSQALFNNLTSHNTAIGTNSQRALVGGNGLNVSVGRESLSVNLLGASNTAIGSFSLFNNTASNNVAVGDQAASTNTTGTGITAIGYQALRVSTGNDNTAVGFQAGDNITTGAGNVCIGSGAEPENATDSNKFVVGSASVNAGAVTAEVITPDNTWTVRINGANYKIPMLAL